MTVDVQFGPTRVIYSNEHVRAGFLLSEVADWISRRAGTYEVSLKNGNVHTLNEYQFQEFQKAWGA